MTNLDRTHQNNEIVLLIFSGSSSSLLAACYLLEQGYRVYMVTYSNGCMSNVDNVKTMADRIIKKYGSDKALYLGIQSVAPYLHLLQKSLQYSTIGDLSQKDPYLCVAQIPCLACHTGMFVRAIAYCKVHKISYIAQGIRKSQNFFIKLPDMVKQNKVLAEENGIRFILPVYNLTNNQELQLKLEERGFSPKTLEPQCWIGYPLGKNLCLNEIDNLTAYYNDEIRPKLQSLIDEAEIGYFDDKLYKECSDHESQYAVLAPPCILSSDFLAKHWGYQFVKMLMEYNINLISLPCPVSSFSEFETDLCCGKHSINFYLSLDGYNEHCVHLAEKLIQKVLDMQAEGYRFVCLLGVEHSPTCATNYMYSQQGTIKRSGIFNEILSEKLNIHGLEINHIGINRKYPKKALNCLCKLILDKINN